MFSKIFSIINLIIGFFKLKATVKNVCNFCRLEKCECDVSPSLAKPKAESSYKKDDTAPPLETEKQ